MKKYITTLASITLIIKDVDDGEVHIQTYNRQQQDKKIVFQQELTNDSLNFTLIQGAIGLEFTYEESFTGTLQKKQTRTIIKFEALQNIYLN